MLIMGNIHGNLKYVYYELFKDIAIQLVWICQCYLMPPWKAKGAWADSY